MKPVMSQLLKSQHFYDKVIRGSMIKSPIDCMIGVMREFSLLFPNKLEKPDHTSLAAGWNLGQHMLNILGQGLSHQTALGWKAYYDAPYYDRHWLNGASQKERQTYINRYIRGEWNVDSAACGCSNYPPEEHWEIKSDLIAMVQSITTTLSSTNAIATAIDQHLMTVPLCTQAINKLKSALETSANNWQSIWTQYNNNPMDENLKNEIKTRLGNCFEIACIFEEYHLI
jgi:hypothetical protein